MYELVEANWLLILLAFLIGLAIAWYIFNVRRRTRVTADRRDVLDEGAARAQRNQAFLDAPNRPVDDHADLSRKISSEPIAVRPVAEPPGTTSLPTPGSILGAETIVNLAAGTPAVIGLAEQEETDAATHKDSDDILAAAPAADVEEVGISPVVAPAIPDSEDELTRLKGVGPKLAAQLKELGVTRFDQIAAWDEATINRIDAQLGRFQGRIRRDEWVTQARLLSSGDQAEYETKFGRL
jgi:predicted flap endonuclease-1-like 5' DNA nuclease